MWTKKWNVTVIDVFHRVWMTTVSSLHLHIKFHKKKIVALEV